MRLILLVQEAGDRGDDFVPFVETHTVEVTLDSRGQIEDGSLPNVGAIAEHAAKLIAKRVRHAQDNPETQQVYVNVKIKEPESNGTVAQEAPEGILEVPPEPEGSANGADEGDAGEEGGTQ
jgi:hypothetical protein